MRKRALERMLSSVLPLAPRRLRGRNRKGRKRTLIPAAATLEALEPRLLLSVATFNVVADGNVNDTDLDGFFEAVVTDADAIIHDWFDDFDDVSGRQMGIYEFDLRDITAGSNINSAAISFFVNSWSGAAGADVYVFAGDGVITASDATTAGTFIGTFNTADVGGDQQHTLISAAALEAFAGGLVTLRIESNVFNGDFFAINAIESGFPPAQLILDVEAVVPELQVNILATSINENDGSAATTATVTRTGSLTNPLNVLLETTGKITAPAMVTIPAGAASVSFDIGVLDDLIFGTDTTAILTARAEVPALSYSLDPTFSGDGVIPAEASTGFQSVAIDSAGRLVTTSYRLLSGMNLFDIVANRFLPDGSPDTSFDFDGRVQTDVTGEKEVPEAVLVQPDGKIVVAGTANSAAGDFVLVRYNADGSLDASFGTGGKVVTEMGPDSFNEIWDLALQSDGKLVAATYSSNSGGRVVRYNANGTLDASFGTGGISPVGMGGRAFGIAVQSDGKIVITGENNGGNFDSTMAVARYNSNGTIDSTFGSIAIGLPGDYDQGNDVLIQPDGKILLVGQTATPSSFPPAFDVAIVRLLSDGNFDTSFGSGGGVFSDFGGPDDIGSAVALLPDGDIIVGGTGGASSQLGFARYNPNGSLQSSHFNFTGATNDEVTDVLVQPDGRIAVTTTGHLLRYSSVIALMGSDSVVVVDNDTNLPPVLNNVAVLIDENTANGVTIATPSATDDPAQTLTYAIISGNNSGAFAINPSTGVITVADSTDLDYETNPAFVLVVRATDNGAPAMSDDATVTVSLKNLTESAPIEATTLSVSLAAHTMSESGGLIIGTVTRSGNLGSPLTVFLHSSDSSEATVPASLVIAAGETSATFNVIAAGDNLLDGTQDVTITASAAPLSGSTVGFDDTFGGGGIADTALEMNIQPPQAAMAIQPDGKIVAAGEDPHTGSWRLTRLNTDGSVDTTFGTNGVVTTTFGAAGTFPVPHKVIIDRFGRILVGGEISSTGLPALARYSANGAPDTTTGFGGGDGIANIDAIGGWVEDIIMLPDDDIMLAVSFNGSVNFRVARLNYSGSFDSFGTGGILNLTTVQDNAQSIERLDNGQFIIAGGNTVARILGGGILDTNFGVNGVQTLTFGGASSVNIFDTQMMADGRILISATIDNLTNNTSNFAVARLTAAGQLDTSFSGDGWIATDFSGFDDRATTMALQHDGKLLVGGYTETSDGLRDIALVRYNLDGSLDTSFDGDGRYSTSVIPGTAEQIFDMALLPDGRLTALAGWGSNYVVARFNMGPKPQLLYAQDALTVTDATPAPSLSLSIAVDAISENGGMTIGTVTRTGDLSQPLTVTLVSSDTSELTVPPSVTIAADDSSAIFAVTAIDDALLDGTINVSVTASAVLTNGQPLGVDATFGTAGFTDTDLVVQTHLPQVTRLADGKYIAAGQDLLTSDLRLTRFNADGTVDTTFGVGGSVTTTLGSTGNPGLGAFPIPQIVLQQPDGKILVGGENFTGSNSGALLVRYNADGTLDTTFGQGGVADIDEVGGQIVDIVFEPDGKLTLAIESGFRLARLNADGSFDLTFGTRGIRNYSLGVGLEITRIVKQPDGKYLLAGDTRIARIHADGSLDDSFGSFGTQTISLGTRSFVTDLQLMDDGRILIGVQDYTGTDNTYNFGAIRLTANGQFDPTFDGDGKVVVDFAAVDDLQIQMAVQDDGKILLGGFTEVSPNIFNPALVRLNSNGSLDISFDGDGRYQTSLMAGNHGLLDFVLDEQGRIVLLSGAAGNIDLYRFGTGVQTTNLEASDTIDVTNDDTNAPPVIADQSFGLDENSANGTFVGTVLASDPDAGQTLTYAIIAGNHAMYSDRSIDPDPAFAIDSSGQLTVADVQQIDFELDATWMLTVRVTDNLGTSTDATITININDLNEAPVVSSPSGAIVENHPVGETVLGVAASDPDGDTLSYAITGGNTGNVFSINPNTGKLSVVDSGPLDFETNSGYTLTIRVTDNGSPQMFTDVLFPISLLDANEAPVVTGGTTTLAEGAPNGTPVFTPTATDQDAGQTLTFAITGGNTSGAFTIHSATGAITVADSTLLDITTNPSFTLTVQATDNGSPMPLSGSASVVINLTDTNQAPVVNDQAFSIAENSGNGTIIGAIAAIDPDAGDTLTFALTGSSHPSIFAVSAAGVITVAEGTLLDFETLSSVTLNVQVSDSGDPALSDTAVVTIDLTNVNETPTVTGGPFTIAENSAAGTPVGTVSGSDVDAGSSLSYSIIGGNVDGAFTIDMATGQITVATSAALNFEMMPLFNLSVQASDGTLTGSSVVAVALMDVNEAPSLDDAALGVAENSIPGTIVGTVTGSDVDAGQSLTYAITGGNTDGAFTIDSATGQITVANSAALDFEVNPVFALTVTATDNGVPNLADAAVVTINLNNVNEAPTVADASFDIAENSATGAIVGSLIASDPDNGQTLTYAISAGNTGGAFAIDSSTGQITVANAVALDFESIPNVTLNVQVTDNGSPSLNDTAVVTINLTNVNEVPSVTGGPFMVAENSAAGTSVGSVIGSDPDAGGMLTYSITSGNVDGAFTIDVSTGAISVANPAALNFENTPTFILGVQASDGTLTGATLVTVNLGDVNEAPTANDASFNLPENSAAGTSVGSVTGSDPDSGQTLTYAITAGNTGGAFAIDASTGAITVATPAALDFETNPSFALTVTATDNGAPTLNDTAVVTINLSNVNEAPTLNDATFAIAENSANGTAVGSVTGSDVDGPALTYSIIGGNGTGGAFAINALTGAITVADSSQLNFESTTSFVLDVQVSDNGSPTLTDTTQVTINLTDVNEAPTLNDATFGIAENSANGTTIGTVTGTDPDNGQTLTYAITAGNTGGAFAINSSTGQITVATAALDFETIPSFALTVTATDNGAPTLSDTAVVTINLNNVNEAPTLNDATFGIAENSANGTAVGSVTGNDVDGPALTYSIIGGNGTGGGAFAINALTGAITVADSSQLNFESTSSFLLDVQVSDGGTPTLTDAAQVTINLTDVNEAPTLNDATFSLPENSANGTSVGTSVGTDPDSGQTLTYAITAGNTGGAFAINSSTGQVTVASTAALDFETTPSFALTVTATDNGTPTLSDIAVVTINLSNVNEAPIVTGGTVSLLETSANGTTVFNVTADDPDAGQTLSFAIVAGNASGAFAIDGNTGVITVADSSLLNNEVTSSYALTVEATDNGTPVALSGSAVVTVNITDVNKAPVVEDQSFSINENSANGTAVGSIAATEPDAGQVLTYAITGGNTDGAFTIDSATGQITVANSAALDFEVNPVFALTVTATDNGVPNLADTAAVTINLNDVNEAPSVADATFDIAENSANGTIVGTVTGSDPDNGQTLTYAISAGNTGGAFAIDSSTGQITVANAVALDFESIPNVMLNVQVTDNGLPSLNDTAVVTITLTNVNEVPSVTGGPFMVAESSAAGTSVGSVIGSDPDAGGMLTYSITSGNVDGAFTIDASTGAITVASPAALNFENTPTFILGVQASDGTLTAATLVTVNLGDVNEAPTVNDASFNLPENSAAGTSVGSVTGSDPDSGQTLTYAITAGNTGGAFAIDASTGAITVANAAALDFETNPSFALIVIATDNGVPTLNDSAVVTINLTNVNEAPALDDATFGIAENSANGATVGTLAAVDVDGPALAYSLMGGTGAFAVSADGVITVADASQLNFESTISFLLEVQVSDGGSPSLTDTAQVTINLSDINEAPTVNDVTFGIAENSANGTPIGTVTGTDSDSGQTLTYVITGGNAGGAFAINSSTGQVTVASTAALDFETTPSFALTVTATDNGTPTLSDSAVVTISLSNVNEVPSVTGGTVSLPETSTDGTTVFTVTADDPDVGQTLTFAITAGNASGTFAIDGNTGVITVANSSLLDNEVTPSYALTVEATDNGTPAVLSGSALVTVNITDVNKAPVVEDQSFSVDENSANGITVGSIAASDQDGGQLLTYAITGTHSGAFAVSPSGVITVADNAQLNFETSPTFTFTVMVSDNGTPTLSDTSIVTINLNDLNEMPSVADASFGVAENSANGVIVGSLIASDPDNGQTLTYAISAGNTGGAFAIDSSTGQITVANALALDFETKPNFALTVTATDNGSPSLNDTAVVTINLTNVNEAPNVTGGPFAVAENSAADTSVGSVMGSDPDSGQTLTYAITAGNTGGAFTIDASTGAITVASPAALNFESTPTFVLGVQVTDGTLTGATLVTVNLSNVNEAPTIADVMFNLPENSALGTSVGSAAGTDPDSGQTLTYAITAGNTGGAFAIDASTGAITVASTAAIDFETNPAFALTVTATDNGTPALNDAAVVTINLSNVNEAPTLNDATFAIAENSANGTAVGAVTGSDVDGPALTYSIISGNGTSGGAFAINALTGAITVADSSQLNFESTTSFVLNVQVSDNGSPTLTDTAPVTINLTDVNEAPSVNDASFNLPENSAPGTSVSTVTGADPDNGQTLTYAITAGNTGGAFAIDASTGAITVANAAALDFETTPSFALTVTATDNGTPTLNDTAVVTIDLTNVNEAPALNDATFGIAENSANGATVGTLAAVDVDGPALTYSLMGGTGAFAVSADGVITVADASQLNFESTISFLLDVQVSDGGSPSLTDTAQVTINLSDVNEAPTLNDATFSLPENSANGTTVGTITGSDPDAGQSHSYAIIAGNINGAFAIDPVTGQITVAKSTALNFEVTPTFNLTVQVTDNGVPAASGQATVTVNLTDVTDEGAPPVVADQAFSIDENITAGSSVGTVLASLGEGGSAVVFEIIGGNEPGAFAIHPTTGQLTVLDASQLDYETNPSFALTVKVTDSMDPTLFATASVAVDVNDVPEPVLDILRNGQGGDFVRLDHNAPLHVTLLSTADFDATQIDILSLRFGVTGTEDSLIQRGKNKKPTYDLRDVNNDGLLDLIAQFDGSRTGLTLGDTQAKLTGSLLDGTFISSVQTIVVQSKPGK